MPRFLRLIIWDAMFFLILTAGYAAVQYLGPQTTAAYLVTMLTCAVCGAFLAQLSSWGIHWAELILVGLPALYLVLAPFLSVWVDTAGFLPFLIVPDCLLQSASSTLRMAGALTLGYLLWKKFR